ncbi:hypothetical protein PJF56_01770 [Roseofilum sp. BLCC_M91]|uniref:Uncharacterized protein n=1 Tax=Roseofilum halophilum BLCC-M91 TaxID=3022259 RepID=A0ABT7BEI2_9CYAN|nr:hypothetical protein [Roseofilum halophilum]MDJ1177581.1 hypothetical protein [Roseofilum halophilum BLCC-M91]
MALGKLGIYQDSGLSAIAGFYLPPVVLSATHLNTLAVISLELLKEYTVDVEA